MKIQIDNGFLEYETQGTGIPLLFIHGYPLSRQIWRPQIEGLSVHVLSIAVDLRGHGGSFPFEGPYTMDLLAEDCHQILDSLQLHRPVLICGLSMGGYVVFALYRKYPDLFMGMILTSTRPGADSPEGVANRKAAINNALEHGAGFIANGMLQKIVSPGTLSSKPDLVKTIHKIMADTSVQGIVGASQGMMMRPDSTTLLPQISCPVLIVHGTDDQIIPLREAEMMHQLIPHSHLVKITEAGHLLNLEQPEIFNQAILDFISSTDQS